MMERKNRILLISSANPNKGPGTIGWNMYCTLKEYGQDVDFMTLYQQPDKPGIISFVNTRTWVDRFVLRVKNKIKQVKRRYTKQPLAGYYFFYKKETNPPVATSRVLAKIAKPYNIVIVYFWQGLMSFDTIDKIYDRLHCKFIFICADYSPMSGGCHFTGNCERYKTGCGCCPAYGSNDPNDFTHWNVEYRAKVYNKVKPTIWANTYMIESFFKKSYLLRNQKCVISKGFLDLNLFKPLPKADMMAKYNIPRTKSFIIAFGCQSLVDKRKGMSYMIEALNMVYDDMSDEERKKTLLLSIGRDGEKIAPLLKLEYKDLGFVDRNELPSFYSVSDVFLSSSVNDAGPSTLKQSLACGTPLVSFEMGTALDVLKDKGTGYCAKLCDSQDFANGILEILRMPTEEYRRLRNHCREFVETTTSKKNFVEAVLDV